MSYRPTGCFLESVVPSLTLAFRRGSRRRRAVGPFLNNAEVAACRYIEGSGTWPDELTVSQSVWTLTTVAVCRAVDLEVHDLRYAWLRKRTARSLWTAAASVRRWGQGGGHCVVDDQRSLFAILTVPFFVDCPDELTDRDVLSRNSSHRGLPPQRRRFAGAITWWLHCGNSVSKNCRRDHRWAPESSQSTVNVDTISVPMSGRTNDGAES